MNSFANIPSFVSHLSKKLKLSEEDVKAALSSYVTEQFNTTPLLYAVDHVYEHNFMEDVDEAGESSEEDGSEDEDITDDETVSDEEEDEPVKKASPKKVVPSAQTPSSKKASPKKDAVKPEHPCEEILKSGAREGEACGKSGKSKKGKKWVCGTHQ